MANPQAIPPPTYLYPIPSLCSAHVGLPQVLGNLDLNRGIQAGDPIDAQNLIDAKSVANALRIMHDSAIDGRVTAEVAVRAEVRAASVEAAHAYATYTPTNIAQALDNLANQLAQTLQLLVGRLDGIDERLNGIDQRLDGIDQRLDGIDQHLVAVDGRLQ